MASIERIETLARDYGERVRALSDEAEGAKADLDDVLARHRPALKALAKARDKSHAKLVAAIAESPEIFARPRSRVMHGVKLGFAKAPGRVSFDNAEKVVARIRSQLPELFDTLVKTSRKPVKKALATLPADRLKRLGVTVEEAGDAAFARPAEGDVDRLVATLLNEAPVAAEDDEAEEAA